MGLVLRGLAKVRVSPAYKDVIALNSRHHADVLLCATPDRHFHVQFDRHFVPAALHDEIIVKADSSTALGEGYNGMDYSHPNTLESRPAGRPLASPYHEIYYLLLRQTQSPD